MTSLRPHPLHRQNVTGWVAVVVAKKRDKTENVPAPHSKNRFPFSQMKRQLSHFRAANTEVETKERGVHPAFVKMSLQDAGMKLNTDHLAGGPATTLECLWSLSVQNRMFLYLRSQS